MWAAPMRSMRQQRWQNDHCSVRLVQPATWTWQLQPARPVTRQTLPRVAGPVRIVRRTMLVSTAPPVSAPVPLPHLLCRSPKGGHLPDQTYEVTKEAPSQVQKKELAPAAELEEFPYPKGKPVSYGPPKMEIEPTAQPATQASAAEPQQNEDVIEIPQTQQTHPEVIEDPQTEAEALANLQALMGELQRLGGSKPPVKPHEDPIIGDVVVLSKDVEPSKYGLCYAVITEAGDGEFVLPQLLV